MNPQAALSRYYYYVLNPYDYSCRKTHERWGEQEDRDWYQLMTGEYLA